MKWKQYWLFHANFGSFWVMFSQNTPMENQSPPHKVTSWLVLQIKSLDFFSPQPNKKILNSLKSLQNPITKFQRVIFTPHLNNFASSCMVYDTTTVVSLGLKSTGAKLLLYSQNLTPTRIFGVV